MWNAKLLACAVALCFCAPQLAHTAENDAAPPIQKFSITIADETVVLRASAETRADLLQAMIATLQEQEYKNFSVEVKTSIEQSDTEPTATVTLANGKAVIRATRNVPYRLIASIVSMLEQEGVRRVSFAVE